MKQAKYFSSDSEKSQQKIYAESKQLAGGKKPFGSSRITKSAISAAESARTQWENYGGSKKKSAPLIALLSFCMAAEQDLKYAAVGRHYLRANAVTGRNAAACGRAHLVGMAKEQLS